jgi:hypothetical protein
VSALGYIELKDGKSRFVPIVRPERMVAMFLGATLSAAFAACRAVTRSSNSARSSSRVGGERGAVLLGEKIRHDPEHRLRPRPRHRPGRGSCRGGLRTVHADGRYARVFRRGAASRRRLGRTHP